MPRDQSHSVMETAITSNKKQIFPYHVYAYLLLKHGDREGATAQLMRCQKIEKDNETTVENLNRLQNGKKLSMKRFGMAWYALQLERPPASMGTMQGGATRKGFRQRSQRRGKR